MWTGSPVIHVLSASDDRFVPCAAYSLPMTGHRSTPADLDGKAIGPVEVAVTRDRVAFYADTTGDDPTRWLEEAPPGFGSVLLFAAADEFLYDPTN